VDANRRLIRRGLAGPVPPEGWTCNGCGGKYTGWLVPDFWFSDACEYHDWHYAQITERLRRGQMTRVRAYRLRREADYRLWRNIVYLSGARVNPRGRFVVRDFRRPRAWAGVVIGAVYCAAVRVFGVRCAR
jgi:hypothetical protein